MNRSQERHTYSLHCLDRKVNTKILRPGVDNRRIVATLEITTPQRERVLMDDFTINAENAVKGMTLDFLGTAAQDITGAFHPVNVAEIVYVEHHPSGDFIHVNPAQSTEMGALAIPVQVGQAFPILG